MKPLTILRKLSPHKRGFYLWSTLCWLALSACDGAESPQDDRDGGQMAGLEAGAVGGSAAGAALGGAGLEAGLEAGAMAGAGTDRPELSCGPQVTAQLSASGGRLSLQEGASQGSSLLIPEGALMTQSLEGGQVIERVLEGEASQEWGLGCLSLGEELLPEGWSALSPSLAVSVSPDELREAQEGAARLMSPATLTVLLPAELPEGLSADHIQLMMAPINRDLSFESLPRSLELAPAPLVDSKLDLEGRSILFSIERPGLYQLAYQAERLSPRPRRLSYQAIVGVSMGGGAAATIAARHPERFDFVGALGGASDWVYLIDYSKRRLFGGFCEGSPAESCEGEQLVDELEYPSTFERWRYSSNGGDFDRDQYVKIFQDISLIFGNPTSFNPESPYLPAGVPLEELTRSRRERCAPECRGDQCEPPEQLLSLTGFYDRRYNPEATHPVISFCDGEDGGDKGAFDGEVEHEKPIEIALAVDLNQNGRRDSGEPVIKQHSEPFEDVGCDGLPSAQEEGYHPVYNPDPSGDDFHWRDNPRGTEGDGLFQGAMGAVGLERADPVATPIPDAELERVRAGLLRGACQALELPGEPWLDLGLDGVAMTPQYDEGGYDWGEGDGAFNYNPNYVRVLSHNAAHALFARMPPRGASAAEASAPQLPRFWLDGGIRDLFNFVITGMHLTGRLQGEVGAGGAPLRVFNGFKRLNDAALIIPNKELNDQLRGVGWHVLMRYGDPEATQEQIDAGDGQHVGSETQALNRFSSFLWWVSANWPEVANFEGTIGSTSPAIYDEVESEGFGGLYTFTVVLPPGYNLPENSEARYPVVYLLHGYGQRHRDMAQTSTFFSAMMGTKALQKMIFVYPDGSCGARWVRGDGPECSDGLDNDLDGLIDLEDTGCITPDDDEADCREGSFYTRHAAWEDGAAGGRDYEAGFLDMMEAVQQRYRVRQPEELMAISPD